ncbi:hypothetical protein [Saccharococcus caldoxylosilyticus]|uniref:hypothetical protein n=1 Tax=Saccharococcus caldoxylosilyticus TaxID=81408 RepID=UPI001C4E110E|nr:hypothetical protein [Parageobacillus caldoxylosilyticus]QXJ39056.1 hypothetical protein BV455_02421 [Parageobacillus caldoxylosilyticus]BDG37254.1 hypothetical protein PcaKH15_31600 [Parageobacillus caldoxylosilyticus]BDG41045.1 hypothetical protein PcaKH16_31840 [Parageobacillus caldoxylosilyticus]BDG44799.1 hypothetical protein PcaKH35_31440 [Parageobacillus caldoxylosilyticus]
MDKFKGISNLKINIPEIQKPVLKMPEIDISAITKVTKEIEQKHREIAIKQQEKEEREKQLLLLVEQIMKNTAYLPEMVGLIRKNNEINEEMLELFKEMTNVLKAQTEEEAKGIVMDIIEKAKNTNDALDAISGLINYGKLLIKLMFPESNG